MNSVEFSVLRRGDVVVWAGDGQIGLVYNRTEKYASIIWESGKHDAYSETDAVWLRPFEVSE